MLEISDNYTEEVRHSSGRNLIKAEVAPYTVVVRCENTGALCTGSLIALDIVLTLARCFYQGNQLKESETTVEILAGVDTLKNVSVDGRTQRKRVDSLKIHPNFRPTSQDKSFGYNDLALVVTEGTFKETPTVHAIKVGFLDWGKIDTTKCVVASYGAINPFTTAYDDDDLKQSEVVSSRTCPCQDSLDTAFGTRTQRWLCVIPHKSGPNPCVGAAGAGLVCGKQLIGVLLGLVSFHDLSNCHLSRKTSMISCDNKRTVPVFLELCPFMPWFRFNFEGLPVGPVNCSKASNLYVSCYILLVVVLTLMKGK